MQRGDVSTSLAIYRRLLLVRRSEERIVKHYPEDEMKTPMHMSMGQEAAPVGICLAIGDRLQITASYRSHAPFLARTANTERFFGEMFGKVAGTAEGKAGSMHLSDPASGHLLSSGIVAAGIAPAVGAAYANKQLRNGKIVAAFFGDGALDEGVFWESLNIASLMKLPVIFVCEDNGFAVHTPTAKRHGFESIDKVIQAFDCGFLTDESNDAESIFELARTAMSKIDESAGPVFMHCRCHRYLEHVGIGLDFDKGYRSQKDVEAWQREKDCLLQQRNRLAELGLSPKDIAEVEEEVDREVTTAVSNAKEAELPTPERLFRGVFHETD
jgi:acetoin:2,6-dichlorophenolindophenol oxidoreductase subunit alpha